VVYIILRSHAVAEKFASHDPLSKLEYSLLDIFRNINSLTPPNNTLMASPFRTFHGGSLTYAFEVINKVDMLKRVRGSTINIKTLMRI
jgi:hypothetical protein